MKLCRDFIKSKLFYRLDFHKLPSVIFHFSCEHTPPANQINILFQNFIAFFSLTSFAFQSISLFLCIFVFFAKQNAFPLKEKSRQKKTTQSIEKKMDVTMTPKKTQPREENYLITSLLNGGGNAILMLLLAIVRWNRDSQHVYKFTTSKLIHSKVYYISFRRRSRSLTFFAVRYEWWLCVWLCVRVKK